MLICGPSSDMKYYSALMTSIFAHLQHTKVVIVYMDLLVRVHPL